MADLLSNIHIGLYQPDENSQLIGGDYVYYHYGCDGVNDQVNTYCKSMSQYRIYCS